ncbi:hypothetical protein CC85DRAFT_29646 [Cutaneotrichosporon oleaginosum]|uniref:Uncharacterized protein n=1 Tax=Cutaneotrichosporon oleaginosum TaxID=879819 RepID=A0A0J0XSJ5_9TREE|nr:uncharacterized protein CC85DRAFT_29646 [Cutaneotrichosporon oleaginosum]KLT44066.1 hypothetical protein CC85DRAFT_29646 [Cutaneotrichosporon oleaginosum]TXT09478.1 hypothetical protein COLE_03412 [Cutaneotrichosporon oleaginosum]
MTPATPPASPTPIIKSVRCPSLSEPPPSNPPPWLISPVSPTFMPAPTDTLDPPPYPTDLEEEYMPSGRAATPPPDDCPSPLPTIPLKASPPPTLPPRPPASAGPSFRIPPSIPKRPGPPSPIILSRAHSVGHVAHSSDANRPPAAAAAAATTSTGILEDQETAPPATGPP